MKNKDQPAYPLQTTHRDNYGEPYYNVDNGLTKLEAFTKAAMTGLLSSMITGGWPNANSVASHAICIAKETLKQLEQAKS